MSQLDLLITALYFSVCCEKYSITKNTWDVIIMKNLNTNDSEFYCSPLVVLHVKPTFVSSEWTLSIQLGSGKIRINNNKKLKIAFADFFAWRYIIKKVRFGCFILKSRFFLKSLELCVTHLPLEILQKNTFWS